MGFELTHILRHQHLRILLHKAKLANILHGLQKLDPEAGGIIVRERAIRRLLEATRNTGHTGPLIQQLCRGKPFADAEDLHSSRTVDEGFDESAGVLLDIYQRQRNLGAEGSPRDRRAVFSLSTLDIVSVIAFGIAHGIRCEASPS